MDEFLKELPALIITLAILGMATILITVAHVSFGDVIAIISPAVSFWFMRSALAWQPSPQLQPPPSTPLIRRATIWQNTPGSTTPPAAGQ
jgi:hypothetical protein